MNSGIRSPGLESLSAGRPKRKAAQVKLLWPQIRACLNVGHSVRDVHAQLVQDGFVIAYTSLCRCITQLRSDNAAGDAVAAPPAKTERPHSGSVVDSRRPVDPLGNVRRLTDANRPGFRYPGTLPEKELFGE